MKYEPAYWKMHWIWKAAIFEDLPFNHSVPFEIWRKLTSFRIIDKNYLTKGYSSYQQAIDALNKIIK